MITSEELKGLMANSEAEEKFTENEHIDRLLVIHENDGAFVLLAELSVLMTKRNGTIINLIAEV